MEKNPKQDHYEKLKEDLKAPPYVLPSQMSPAFETFIYGIITDGAYKRVILSKDEETGIFSAKYIPKVTTLDLVKGGFVDRRGKANLTEYVRRRFDEMYLAHDLHTSFMVGEHSSIHTSLSTHFSDVSIIYNLLINDITSVKYNGEQDMVFSLQGVNGRSFEENPENNVPLLLEHASSIEELALKSITSFVKQNMYAVLCDEKKAVSSDSTTRFNLKKLRYPYAG